MGRYFGTDGFRGEANGGLTAEHGFAVGRFLGWYFGVKRSSGRARILIGKDTRRSSYMFEYSLAGGITASGADAYLLHVTTTPSVSYVTRTEDFDCGVMISASHNLFYDNGIKLLNSQGEKMDEETISYIEDYLDGKLRLFGADYPRLPFAKGEKIGRTVDHVAGRNRYMGYLVGLAQHSFKGMKVGLDCANGGAWSIAQGVFEALGAKTYVIHAKPDGCNINQGCGSTHPEALQKLVMEQGLDVGFAYDGDADRCICVDAQGSVVNGDYILYILGKYMGERGQLAKNRVVTTVMSNFGLYKALEAQGLSYAKTRVGDKYVYEYMQEHGCCLGGEQSGHIIIQKYATTGDGILTSLKLMEVMLEKKKPLRELCEGMEQYPQVMKNVPVGSKTEVMEDPVVRETVEAVEQELGDSGRILVRGSGTEPVVRVMVEARSEELCRSYVDRVVEVICTRGHARI